MRKGENENGTFRKEKDLQAHIRLEFNHLLLWRNNRGVADYGGIKVVYGLAPGASDLIGMVRNDGRFVAIETKSERDDLSDAQEDYIAMVNANGGIGIAAWRVSDVANRLRDEGVGV